MAQQGYGPPSLPVGTEVSAKYRGAFCEAKVKTVTKIVKCKIQLKESQMTLSVLDEEIKGPTKIGAVVEVKHPSTGHSVEATIHKLFDQSLYTVVFDDGDERTLRRTQLCLKGDRHFIESETLDNLPLSHPEHFGTPVLHNKKARRKADEENDEEESEEESPRRAMYRGRHQELVGKLFLIELPNRKGSAIPALVVLPNSTSISEVKRSDQILVRSFKDSKYSTVTRKQLKEFSRSLAIKNEDKTMRTAFEKALLYFDTKELPVGWKRDDMLGSDVDDEDVVEDNEYASEDEPFEEKDRFVAQLYKFMDERGTPINKGPCIGNKDLNLYKLFKIVQNLGGYNKVTKEIKWHVVYSKMGLPSMHQNPAHQVKSAYKKYLDAYEAFYRKLGNSMGTHSRPGRARQNSGRSILNYRSREKSPRLPKPNAEKKEEPDTLKAKLEVEKSEDSQDSASIASAEEAESVPRRTTQRRERLQVAKERDESKDKEKKEKDEPTKAKDKKDDVKAKKEETPASAVKCKKEDVSTPVGKGKKEDVASKAKNENSAAKKEDKKPVRKVMKTEEEKDDKSEKKPIRAIRKEKEDIPTTDSAKKRITRRKLLNSDKDEDSKDDDSKEDKKELALKKALPKDTRIPSVDRKEIPRTLERRDSKTAEKKASGVKVAEVKSSEKKIPLKVVEDKKIVKRDKKGKELEKEEVTSDREEKVESCEDQKQEKGSAPRIEYPIGTKLRVKYGKGKNQKMYIAKVVDTVVEGPYRNYLVHYAGWNMRYDEWIRGDRVASILDKATGVEKPDIAKKSDGVKATLKVHKPMSSSLKRLNTHHTPMLAKKPNQIFRTPKVLNAKTRATRSSSSETSTNSPTMSSDKRTTRRRSVVADVGGKEEESQQAMEAEGVTGSQENSVVVTKDDPEEDAQLVDVEDEDDDEDEDALEKNEMDTSLEDDEEVEDEDKVKSEVVESVNKEQVKSESEEESEVKIEMKEESEPVEEDVKKEEEEEQGSVVDELGDHEEEEEEEEVVSTAIAKQKSSVIMAEVKDADDEITSALLVDESEKVDAEEACDNKFDISGSASGLSSQESEKEGEEEVSVKTDFDGEDDEGSSENAFKKDEEEMTSEEKSLDDQEGDDEDKGEASSDQNIPLLKKVDVDSDRTKLCKSRKKEAGKDAKKLGKSFSSDASNTSTEIPTLEPILMSPEPPAVKSSSSPYDFDEAETENQWQPEISKKWDADTSEQAPSQSKESTPVAGDVMDKEKKKVKKKTKKKISGPQLLSDTKSDEMSISSQPNVESVCHTAESNVNEEDRLSEKQGLKKKGRKRKDMGAAEHPRAEVIDQYESTVNSVVEAVKHSLREESCERETSKPTPKKRRLKRVSESDKRDLSRASKPERRRGGLRDSQDTVEALNVEGSKGKSAVSNQSLLENVMMLTSKSKQSSSEAVSSSNANENVETKTSNSETCNEEDNTANGTQPFMPQMGGEDRTSSGAHFENTPPTTPEHEEGEGCAPSSQQQMRSTSPCSDDLALKSDSLKDGSLSSSSSISLPASSSNVAPAKSNSESPSEDNDVGSTTSNDNLDAALTANQGSESSGTEQEVVQSRKRKPVEEPPAVSSAAKKKKRVHGTRSRTAKKSPKYISTDSVSYQTRISDSHMSSSSNQYIESPLSRLADLTKSPRPSKYNFNADLGEYLEGEERCNFLIGKMKEIKAIYMNLKSEVASIDRRRKRIRRKERESSQASPSERDSVR